jgi:putative endonuclease
VKTAPRPILTLPAPAAATAGPPGPARPLIDRRQIGRAAEERAVQFLRDQGLAIVLRNYRCRQGELDIVARERGVLVIVEVRLRSHADYGGALASITHVKRHRIARAARHLAACHAEFARLPMRFDVVAVPPAPSRDPEWLRAAFDAR